MLSPNDILRKYWGFESFRSKQLEVIQTVLEGKDVLTLMPTGGGKSLCFQIPALMQEGICIVISPLIALMKDQVSALQSKNIKALAINSGMNYSEIDIALDNCIYGNYKFLYLSPERLQNEMVQKRIEKMNVNLIAVDEAHCISEWGYDFRPSYLKIAELRSIIDAPIIALTATATKDVVGDIQEKLCFKDGIVQKKSFIREKLSYVVLHQEDKDSKLIRILNKVKGSAIIYCKTRKETKRIYSLLQEHGISANFYHGGLDISERDSKQKQWQNNHVRVMVTTNAFGMGIDKPDVRVVIHTHLPNSLEAYFQEAGRAGRDNKMSYAILLSNNLDTFELKKHIEEHYPKIENIRNVYQQMANHFGLAIGSGKGEEFIFHIQEFCQKYNLNRLQTFNILKLLEKEEFIKLSDAIHQPTRLHIKVDHNELYQFQIANSQYDLLLKTILRSYQGVFDSFTKIQESIIGKRAQIDTQIVKQHLKKLHELNLIEYIPQNSNPKLYFIKERLDAGLLPISEKKLANRKAIEEIKATSVINYVHNQHECRSRVLLNYFDEPNSARCGICDVCLERNKLSVRDNEFDEIAKSIQKEIFNTPMTTDEIILKIVDFREDKMIHVLQFLCDNGQIEMTKDQKLIWKH